MSRAEVLRAAAGSAARRLDMSSVGAEKSVPDVGAARRKADVVRLWSTLQRGPGANVGGRTGVGGHSVPGRLFVGGSLGSKGVLECGISEPVLEMSSPESASDA